MRRDEDPATARRSSSNARNERGSALVGLSVAVVVAGATMAAAIPGYQHIVGVVKTYAATTELSSAVQEESAYLITNSTYGTATQLAKWDPGVDWTVAMPTASSGKAVTVDAMPAGAPSNTVLLGEKAQDGSYYWAELANGRVTYAIRATAGEPSYRAVVGWSWGAATNLP